MPSGLIAQCSNTWECNCGSGAWPSTARAVVCRQLVATSPLTIIEADAGQGLLTLRLADGRTAGLERTQVDEADVRLAYVQHPFIAQGQTTDTAHVIISEHTTAEGSYVAITRARQATHIHAGHEQLELEKPWEELDVLGKLVGRSEPEIPSIRYPLAPKR